MTRLEKQIEDAIRHLNTDPDIRPDDLVMDAYIAAENFERRASRLVLRLELGIQMHISDRLAANIEKQTVSDMLAKEAARGFTAMMIQWLTSDGGDGLVIDLEDWISMTQSDGRLYRGGNS